MPLLFLACKIMGIKCKGHIFFFFSSTFFFCSCAFLLFYIYYSGDTSPEHCWRTGKEVTTQESNIQDDNNGSNNRRFVGPLLLCARRK